MTREIPPPSFEEMIKRPIVVCLCGSTRFYEEFRKANLRETLAGRIVLSIGCDFKSDDALGLTDADKIRLDELHKRKIDLADEILVLNVGKYIGSSTRSEIEYAVNHGKNVRYLEPDDKETGWCLIPPHSPGLCPHGEEQGKVVLCRYDDQCDHQCWDPGTTEPIYCGREDAALALAEEPEGAEARK